MVRSPAGTRQENAGNAAPGAEVTSVTLQSDGVLQLVPPAAVVSQTKRMRLPAGGVMVSVMPTPEPNEDPLLVTVTR